MRPPMQWSGGAMGGARPYATDHTAKPERAPLQPGPKQWSAGVFATAPFGTDFTAPPPAPPPRTRAGLDFSPQPYGTSPEPPSPSPRPRQPAEAAPAGSADAARAPTPLLRGSVAAAAQAPQAGLGARVGAGHSPRPSDPSTDSVLAALGGREPGARGRAQLAAHPYPASADAGASAPRRSASTERARGGGLFAPYATSVDSVTAPRRSGSVERADRHADHRPREDSVERSSRRSDSVGRAVRTAVDQAGLGYSQRPF